LRGSADEWENLPKYRRAKLVASYPRRLKAVIATKGSSKKYCAKGLNTYVNVIFDTLFFALSIIGYCVQIEGFLFWISF
jgi:hypothetical protein